MNMLDPRQRALAGAMRAQGGLPQGQSGLPQAPTLADLFAPPAQPVAVSPGSPAPVKPGVDIQPPARPILSPRPPAPAQADPFSALYDQMRESSQAGLRGADALRAADASATVSPEQQEVFDKQEARLVTDAADAKKLERDSNWDALINMGISMAKSNSPFFATALAEGLQAGSQGLSASRAERARSKALLLDKEDQIRQARIAALTAARTEARQMMVDGANLDEKQMRIAAMGDETLLKRATAQSAIRKAAAEAVKAEFDAESAPRELGMKEALTGAQINNLGASAEESRAGAAAYRSGQRGGRGSQGDRYDQQEIGKAEDSYQTAVADANKARREWQMEPGRDDRRSKEQRYNDVMASQEKALIAANAMRRMKGQAPITLRQLFPSGNGATQRALTTPDPLGLR